MTALIRTRKNKWANPPQEVANRLYLLLNTLLLKGTFSVEILAQMALPPTPGRACHGFGPFSAFCIHIT